MTIVKAKLTITPIYRLEVATSRPITDADYDWICNKLSGAYTADELESGIETTIEHLWSV